MADLGLTWIAAWDLGVTTPMIGVCCSEPVSSLPPELVVLQYFVGLHFSH